MMAWISAALSAFLEWLGVAICYTLAGLLIIAVLAFIVLAEIEKYKDERRKESA